MSQTRQKEPPFSWRTFPGYALGIAATVFYFTTLMMVNLIQMMSLIIRPFSRLPLGRSTVSWREAGGASACSAPSMLRRQPVITGDAIPVLESTIVVCNHQQMPDILALMMLARRKERLGDMKWFVKDVLKWVPGIGWGMLFLDCLFVKRNWDADAARIHATFSKFQRENIPLWLVSFSEGTRLTPAKLARSQEYAAKAGLPGPSTCLFPVRKGSSPRLKGYAGTSMPYTMSRLDIRTGSPRYGNGFGVSLISVHLRVNDSRSMRYRRIPALVAQWLLDCFREKDELLTHFEEHGCFPLK